MAGAPPRAGLSASGPRTELIAKADNDRRAVALIPLSEPARDATLMPGGNARVALRQVAPKPYASERVETLPAIERFLKTTGDSEIGGFPMASTPGEDLNFSKA